MPLNTMPSNTVRCGVAGWSYPHWNGVVFPRVKPRGFHPLEFLAGFVDTVEINTSFYQPLKPEVTRLWAKKVEHNRDFLFTAKLHRRFTHDRVLDLEEIARFREGLLPLHRQGKLGALLMQFPWSFRFTAENRDFFVRLRRTFHEFPLVAEMRHDSWMLEEALGTFIDHHVGFCNIDQPVYTRAMPPTAFLTSPIGYVRLHGRNPMNALGAFAADAPRQRQHDYLYEGAELSQWKTRIDRVARGAERVFVVANNDPGGKSVVNALELQRMFDAGRDMAPPDLRDRFRDVLLEFRTSRAQQELFIAA
jgi:uncharacterized protein YecE (DUF72 family)